ncbi:insulinase family protein (plasmid) [Pedobacter sp. BS3]|uniref:M16 family metallopeptidase n=1 Tax=Pedobacter sp. BS3 TaxID=2567937 RepID=UPI0011F00CC0|nr:insulinase family protein [Pedobacter sp. BS3]TZF85579.1 insulinase family protein [Pedobacter sp. BS3]
MSTYLKYSAGIVLALLISCNAFSQTAKSKKQPSAGQVLPVDPNLRIGKLANGFTYYIRRNTEPQKRAQLYLVNKVGSVLETDEQLGLAHFMEHMSFNGTKHFPKNELVNYLQKNGVRFGADLNAYTGFDETVYQLPIPTDDPEVFKNAMQIMRDWAQDATLDTTEINKERGVVLEEKRLGKGAQERMQNKYLPVLLNNSRYSKRLPIGTEEVLKSFNRATLYNFYKTWYRPNLQALIVVGDIDVNQVEQQIKAKFSDLKNPAKPAVRTKYTIPLLNKNQFIAVTDNEWPVTVAQILIKHPEEVVKTTTNLRNNIIQGLYNRMFAERFSELSKQANPPFVQGGSSISGFLAGLDVASAYVVARPGELERGFKAVLTEVERVKKFGFTQTELDRAKQSYLTAMETSYNERDKTNSENYVQEYVQLFLKGEASPGIAYEYNFAKSTIGGIKLAEVNQLASSYITDTNRDILIMAPEKDKASLPDETKVNQWINDIKTSNITPYVDDVNKDPLLAQKPVAGKIVSEKTDATLGTTELVLSNGVKVYLKPTDFKNDEIQFNAFSPGGTSRYSDADYQSAANSANIIGRSGVGNYTPVQLTKYLSDKQAFVSPYISERTQGLNGFATPKDLETALQLTYLYFTSPRKDSSIFNSSIAKAKASLANRSDDPSSVFADTIAAVLSNYNERNTGPSIEKINQIDLNKAYNIYRESFANAKNFTFTFVGNFDKEKLKPLIEQYIGSLPSGDKNTEARDLGIHIPEGKIAKSVYKGREEKASVRLVFSGDYTYSPENNNEIDALGEVLQIKLIERLREEESGVYSPGVRTNYVKYPKNRYSYTIVFSCAPANVEKLISAALDEINKIKANGPQETDLQKFVAEERRSTETQLKQNSFWLSYLSGQYQNHEDPAEILSYLDSLKKLNVQGLKEAANKYLSGNNYIRFVLLPEKK